MKLTIQSDRPISKEQLSKMIHHAIHDDHLCKADRKPREMDFKVLRATISQNQKRAEKIRHRMVEKIEAFLKNA